MDRAAAADRRSGMRNRERDFRQKSLSLFFVLSGKQKNGIRIPVLKNSIWQNSQNIIVKYVKITKNGFDK